MIENFAIAALPKIIFGRNCLQQLPKLLKEYGSRTLIVTGARSFLASESWKQLESRLNEARIQWQQLSVDSEPSPDLVDQAAQEYQGYGPDSVVGIGGGSALDAAKAVAGLLQVEHSVLDYLEGVGPELPYNGPTVPMIAIPTTAGTGSEATKNAVLSFQDVEKGYKKSFRSELLVPRIALVDPKLLETCPPNIIAANGMDALTQLMESYVSTKANPLTDALALSGLEKLRDSLRHWYELGSHAEQAQDNMAYAAMLSGVCLAQTGLGSVHGLASPLGAFFPIPHGIVCGTLVAQATRINIQAILEREPDNRSLRKYHELGALMTKQDYDVAGYYTEDLIDYLLSLCLDLKIPSLGRYGVKQGNIDHIVKHSRGSSMKTNPIVLQDCEIDEIIRTRI